MYAGALIIPGFGRGSHSLLPRSVAGLQGRDPNAVLVHGHSLSLIEVYFSIMQRNALTPNDFPSWAAVEERLLAFERHYESFAKPFE